MYVFQSESLLYSCLNVKERLAQNRRNIWSLSVSDGNRTHNHLVCKQTLNHLAKLGIWLVWLNRWVFVCEISGCGWESRCCHLIRISLVMHGWLFKDIDIASLETLAMLANDWHFLKNPNIISYYFNPLKIREH